MTLVNESLTPVIEEYNLEITKRMEDCMSVYSTLDRKSRRLKNPLKEQIDSGFKIIQIKKSIFKNDTQLMQWINKTCLKTVKTYLKIALTNFCNYPLGRNIKVILK